jgi:hypothetical protein
MSKLNEAKRKYSILKETSVPKDSSLHPATVIMSTARSNSLSNSASEVVM